MTRYLRMALAVMILVLGLSVTAHAGKYRDAYTSEDNNGVWTFTAVNGLTTVVTATPSTITSATSGHTYIIAPPAETIVTCTLPDAASGLQYKFVVGNANGADDASTMVLKPSATDIIVYGVATTGSKLRSTKATGATIEVYGGSGVWYVSDVSGTWTVE